MSDMSQPAPRRYLFCEYDSIERLDFERLDQVCERLFILVSSELQHVPFALVRNLQQLGTAVKWVTVDQKPGISLAHHLTFLLGRLHQKLPADIQFAVLSEDEVFDPLIRFINEKGRPALRVQREKTVAPASPEMPERPENPAPETAESSAVERVRQLWLENDLAPVTADFEKN